MADYGKNLSIDNIAKRLQNYDIYQKMQKRKHIWKSMDEESFNNE